MNAFRLVGDLFHLIALVLLLLKIWVSKSVTGNNIDEQRMILDPQRTLAFTICLHINATLNEVTMLGLQRCVSTVRTIVTRSRAKVSATVWPTTSTSTSQRAWTSKARQ